MAATLVAPVMGTTVSIDVQDEDVGQALLERAVARLRRIEARFSTYRPDSEISRLGRGELSIADVHPEVAGVLAACERLRAATDGAFDAWIGGRLDPSGYVKGWAGDEAAAVLRAGGATSFVVNLGGDVVCAGERAPGLPWRVGIRHPDDASRILLAVELRDGAVATSGLYERGSHVRHARTGTVPSHWRSVTVVGSSLTEADALATAALAMDGPGPEWAARRVGFDVAAYGADGRLLTTDGIARIRAA